MQGKKSVLAIFILGLSGTYIVSAQEDGDNYPPIQEGWRCLEDSGRSSMTRWTMLDVVKSTDLMQDDDCPVVTDEICDAADFYPYPCKFIDNVT